eukprot:CAMPEP_0171100408 /NCGR_PEP_ID=MMETSP0766_2-20121228/52942_1 /TAXON_ID=439317 /ORGANISM="Gambierdiscus australes, Strain CAWD 149" /LENGTH=259 /DNA_ID=CAMNT_0011560231 /DNA_START=51 /DNA_END=830 /DNA_ORIENTATION=+
MSARSLKHVVHTRVHLERHQPRARRKLGNLEKHKDYVKRAKNYHSKEDKLKALHRLAYFKNKDEFNFGMLTREHNKDGNLQKRFKECTDEEVILLNSRDKRYVSMRETIDKKAVERQAENLQFLDANIDRQHTLFVDDDEVEGESGAAGARKNKVAKKLKGVDVAAYFDTSPALLDRRANRLRLAQLQSASATSSAVTEASKAAYHELLQRQKRAKTMGKLRETLELQNHLRGKGQSVEVASETRSHPAVHRWLPERKR